MSIIIVAQSLKNDDTSDIQIDGEFSPSLEKLRKLDEFDKNGRAINFDEKNGIKFGKIQGLLPINKIFGFLVNCEEKDNLGRKSPIAIQAKLTEIQNIIPQLKDFKEKSGRTISTEKEEQLQRKIDFEKSTLSAKARIFALKNKKGILFSLIGIVVVILAILISFILNKNKEDVFVFQGVIVKKSVLAIIISSIINKNKEDFYILRGTITKKSSLEYNNFIDSKQNKGGFQ